MPTDDELLPQLAAMRAGEPTAERDLFNACLPRLTAILKRRFPIMPEEAVIDAAADALLDLMTRSERYDPRLGSLLNYLAHIAEHRLLDELRRLKRRREIYIGGTVELSLVEANHYRETNHTEPKLHDPDQLPDDIRDLIATLLPDSADQEAFALICSGRATVTEFAAIWQFEALSQREQAMLVKRNRDRILKRVQRHQQKFRRMIYEEN